MLDIGLVSTGMDGDWVGIAAAYLERWDRFLVLSRGLYPVSRGVAQFFFLQGAGGRGRSPTGHRVLSVKPSIGFTRSFPCWQVLRVCVCVVLACSGRHRSPLVAIGRH